MILTKIITTSKATLLVVGGLPEDAIPNVCCGRCYKPNKNNDGCWSAKECSRGTDYPDFVQLDLSKSWAVDGNKIKLPPGNWQSLGFLKDITEDAASKLVEKVSVDKWKNYRNVPSYFEYTFNTPEESIFSLVEDMEIRTGKIFTNPFLLKKID